MDDLATFELRCSLDAERRRAIAAEAESARLRMLLVYAEAAIMEEFRLRVTVTAESK